MRIRLVVPCIAFTTGCARDSGAVRDQPRSSRERPRGVMSRSVADPGVEPASLGVPVPRQPLGAGLLTPPAAAPNVTSGSPPEQPRTVFVARDNLSKVPAPFSIPLPFEEHPIDLATALKLADVANPTIGAARALVLEALANQLAARVLLVPSLNSGVGYHGHQGFLQRVSGKIISLSEQSLSMGAGVGFVGSGTATIPGVNILTPLTDAWFEPLAAGQRVIGAQIQCTGNGE